MSAPLRRSHRALDLAAAGLFATALLAPSLDRLARPDAARDPRPENREAAPCPTRPASAREAAAWPKRFDDWFADTCGLRDVLLGARNSCLVRLGLAPTQLLDVGPTGWVFYRGDMAFEAHRGTYTLNPRKTDAWIDALEERRARLAERGARFVFVLVPDKEAVYPEFLPDRWRAVGPSLSDVFLGELARRTRVEVVDLRPALLAAKALDRPEFEDYVYFPRGTHWTSRGACAATSAILDHLRGEFPDIAPLDCAALPFQPVPAAREDSWMRNIYAPWLLAPGWILAPTGPWPVPPGIGPSGPLTHGIAASGPAAAPSVHLLHDSYGPFLQPLLAQRFRRLRSSWQCFVDEAAVDLERPDFVILMRAERMLSQPPDFDARTPGDRSPATLTPESAVWRLAPGSALPAIRGAGEARLELAEGANTWTTTVRNDHFVVDAGAAGLGCERYAVVYEIEAATAGNLDLWLAAPGGSEWQPAGQVPTTLRPGLNSDVVVLPPTRNSGRILVRMGPAGTWTIRKLEVHALGPIRPRAPQAEGSSTEPTIRSK